MILIKVLSIQFAIRCVPITIITWGCVRVPLLAGAHLPHARMSSSQCSASLMWFFTQRTKMAWLVKPRGFTLDKFPLVKVHSDGFYSDSFYFRSQLKRQSAKSHSFFLAKILWNILKKMKKKDIFIKIRGYFMWTLLTLRVFITTLASLGK